MEKQQTVYKTITLPVEVLGHLRKEAHEKGWNVSTLIISLLGSHCFDDAK